MTKRAPAIRDYRNAEEVARILAVINPHGYNADMLKSVADGEFHCDARKGEPTTFFGTGGWYATFYPVSDEYYTHDCVFTLMPYAVEAFLIEKGIMTKAA